MHINPNNPWYGPQQGTAAQNRPGRDDFASYLGEEDPAALLHEITKDGVEGMLKWKIEEMKKKIAAEVMASKNITKESLAAMSAEERAATQDMIMREVQEKLKEAMNEQMKRENHLEIGFMNTAPVDEKTLLGLLAAQETADSRGLAQPGVGERAADRSADTKFGTHADLAAM